MRGCIRGAKVWALRLRSDSRKKLKKNSRRSQKNVTGYEMELKRSQFLTRLQISHEFPSRHLRLSNALQLFTMCSMLYSMDWRILFPLTIYVTFFKKCFSIIFFFYIYILSFFLKIFFFFCHFFYFYSFHVLRISLLIYLNKQVQSAQTVSLSIEDKFRLKELTFTTISVDKFTKKRKNESKCAERLRL